MRKDTFASGDSVLLLGEGNFSFSVEMLNLGIELEITATCYETVLTSTQTENCELLKSHGVCLLTGIDATKVHENSFLMTKKFNKIVFNFPHTGGKMKINANRCLLRQFFLSASNLLSRPGGNIIVSLCRGQGADYQDKRTWADSWQVVDLAGHANLLLVECLPFEWASFPLYSNVGYRSLEKGFHTEDAMVHIFTPVDKLLGAHVNSVINYYQSGLNDGPLSRPLFVRKMKRNIFRDNTSPASFILHNLKMHISSKYNCAHYIENKPILHSLEERDIASACKLWEDSGADFFLQTAYIFNELSTNFDQSPVTIQTLFFGNGSDSVFMTAVSNLLSTLDLTDYQILTRECCSEMQGLKKLYLRGSNEAEFLLAESLILGQGEVSKPALLIHFDVLVKMLFSLNCWRQMWADCAHISFLSGKPHVAGICPYPVSYAFDISFVINAKFTEQNFLSVLWDIADDVLVGVIKVSEFTSLCDNKTSLCYRFTYLSYDRPMCRRTVIDFHQNVLGKALETVLGVSLK